MHRKRVIKLRTLRLNSYYQTLIHGMKYSRDIRLDSAYDE